MKKIKNLGGYIYIDRNELKEIDYIEKLSPEDQEWFNRFLDNEYNGRFHNDGKDIITDENEKRKANTYKQRRRNDFYNALYSCDSKDGAPILTPRNKKK